MIGFVSNPYQTMYAGFSNMGSGVSMGLSMNVSMGSSGMQSMMGSGMMQNPMFNMLNMQASMMNMMSMMSMMGMMSGMQQGMGSQYASAGMSNGMSGMFGMGFMTGAKGQVPVQGGGQLQQEAAGKPISYTTSGGYKVSVNKDTINVVDPTGKNTVTTWGDPHQKLNGQDVGDWTGKDRSLVLGDGTKISMHAQGARGVVESMSIYDKNTAIQINNKDNTITNVNNNGYAARSLERSEADGQTAYFGNTMGGKSIFKDIYNQDSSFAVTKLDKLFGYSKGFNQEMVKAS
jgi:hypothetical protein